MRKTMCDSGGNGADHDAARSPGLAQPPSAAAVARRQLVACLVLSVMSAAICLRAADVALFYSNYQEERFRYMPGEYDGQYATAGKIVENAGFDWDRVDSKAVETGTLVKQGYKVLLISYTGVMSRAEADAISEFVKTGGKIFAVYSSCSTEYKDGEVGKPGKCLIADALGMDSAGSRSGCRYMRAELADHPLLRLLPVYVSNPHGFASRMKPRAGTKIVASWLKGDLASLAFGRQDSGAILVSPSAVYFSGWLWPLAEAEIIVRNALSFLLGRELVADKIVWTRATEAARVENGLNLQYAKTETKEVDALGWRIAEPKHGILRPTCVVVYPTDAPESYYAAKRLARTLSCALAPDCVIPRDNLLGITYDLIVVGRLLENRCENFVGNMQRGVIGAVLKGCASTAGKAVVRIGPEGAGREQKRILLVGGPDQAGLRRAEELVRQGVDFDPGEREGRILVWQPESAFGDLVYPWTPVREPIKELKLPAAVNQRAKTQFVVTASMGCVPLDFDLELSPLTGPAGTIASGRTQLLATRYIKSNITKIPEPDPLVPVASISVNPSGHQQVWLIVDCTDVKPGEYSGHLGLLNSAGKEAAGLGVTVDVAPIALAPKNRHALLTTVWDYCVSRSLHGSLTGFGAGRVPEADQRTFLRWNEHYERHFRRHWRAYIRDLEEHGVNVMFLATGTCLPQYQMGGGQIDEDNLEKLVRYGKQHGFRQFILTQILGQSSGSFANTDDITDDDSLIFSPKWDDAYKKLLRAYVQFFQRMGMEFGEWAIYPYDEPHTEHARKVVNHVGELIAETEPRVQLWCDPARPKAPITESIVEFWKSMDSSIDIWCPAGGYIPKGSAALEYLRGLGEPFGFYRCQAYLTKNRAKVQPDSYYRKFGWEVADKGADGMGFWTWCAWLGDSWNDEDISIRPGDGAVIYEGPDGPITSIRWEAWSEGLDDYKYIAALQERIARRQKTAGKNDPRCAKARKMLDEAIAKVVSDPRAADRERARIRETILELEAD